jgi:hypothetical protein
MRCIRTLKPLNSGFRSSGNDFCTHEVLEISHRRREDGKVARKRRVAFGWEPLGRICRERGRVND